VASLVPSPQSDDQGFEGLGSQLAALEATLDERTTAIDRVRSELAAFVQKYRQDVGELHEQLEELEIAIAEAELGEIAKRLEHDASSGTPSTAPQSEAAARYTSDAVRKLFRDVAKAIHPDLADDELARDRRHRLMIEANRAYAVGDEERLRSILQAWENSPEAVQGNDPEAARQRLVRRIAQIEEQLSECDRDLAALKDTALWKLKAMVDAAAKRGTDLVADTVRRLKRDIMVARNRLAAIQSHR
jgi:HPt (histidine-containing phosphotransfer) domain-containing protein